VDSLKDRAAITGIGWTSFVHAFAHMAGRHMVEYGTTSRQMGLVAVAERRHALPKFRPLR